MYIVHLFVNRSGSMSQDYLHVSRSIVLGCFMLRYIYIRSILPESLTLLREQLNMLLFKHLVHEDNQPKH